MNRDLQLSSIVAGTRRLHQQGLESAGVLRWIVQAVELGVTSFDLSDSHGEYAVEAMFGAALAAAPGLRNRLQIVARCGVRQHPGAAARSYDSGRAHVTAAVDAALRALRSEHIDLLLMQRPDLLMDPEDLADTFRQLLAAGKVLHFGVAQHTPGQLAMLRRRHPLAVHCIEFSALQMRALADGTLEQCLDLGLRAMASSPLGGGRLLMGADDQPQRLRGVLQDLGAQHGASAATLAYAWILRHPSRPWLLTGTGRIEGLRDAVAALPIRLSSEDWYRVWQASIGHELP